MQMYPELRSKLNEFPEPGSGTQWVRPYVLELDSPSPDGRVFAAYIPAGTKAAAVAMNSAQPATLYMSLYGKPLQNKAKRLGNRTIYGLLTNDRFVEYAHGGGQKIIVLYDYGVGLRESLWIFFELSNGYPNAYNFEYRIDTDYPGYSKPESPQALSNNPSTGDSDQEEESVEENSSENPFPGDWLDERRKKMQGENENKEEPKQNMAHTKNGDIILDLINVNYRHNNQQTLFTKVKIRLGSDGNWNLLDWK